MWGEDLINHCFWIPFVNNQVFFVALVHIRPWGLYLWPTYWWTLADYRQATTNSSGWGKPVDVLVVFNRRCLYIHVYPCLLLKLHPDFLGKNQEWWVSNRSAFLFFSNFRFFDFVVFFELTFEGFQKKNSQNVLCSWIFEAHPLKGWSWNAW